MNYAMILAGGKGTRFSENLPKQFHTLKGKPVLVHTIQVFLDCKEVDKILVVIPEQYEEYTQKMLKEYFPEHKIELTIGGKDRMDSLLNGCNYLVEHFSITDKDILLTHDAARPFVTERIIEDNIKGLEEADAVTTAIGSQDSILEANGKQVVKVPIRKNMYLIQTPQSFRMKEFMEICTELTEEEKATLTEASKIYLYKKKRVEVIEGESFNFKITTKYDMEVAKFMLEKGFSCLKGE